VLNPATPLASIEWVLESLDFVLIMSVNPGFGGQAFIASSIDKIRALRALLERRGSQAQIEVDGGVNRDTAAAILAAGADVLVAGSAIFTSSDYAAAIQALRHAPADAAGR
jgi:ribulose-phosphate 3-epimerase